VGLVTRFSHAACVSYVFPHSEQVDFTGMAVWYRLALTEQVGCGLTYVERFGKSARVQPSDRVPHLETGVLNGDGETVPGAGAAEGEHVAAWLEHT